jgi:hypothetical protein
MSNEGKTQRSPQRSTASNDRQQLKRQHHVQQQHQQKQAEEHTEEPPATGRSMWQKLFGRWKLKYKHNAADDVSRDVTNEAVMSKKPAKSILSVLVRTNAMMRTRR